jgi:dUTP pyrophosphatase
MTVPLEVLRLDPNARLPERATPGAAGLDLSAVETATIAPGRWALVRTGLALVVPSGYEGQIRPRSGLAVRHGVTVLNAPGTIDSDYRGEVRVALVNLGPEPFVVTSGDRIAQLVIAPVTRVAVVETSSVEPTARGECGFGSTGR